MAFPVKTPQDVVGVLDIVAVRHYPICLIRSTVLDLYSRLITAFNSQFLNCYYVFILLVLFILFCL